jgi:RHS repeat-associated protein
MAHQVPSVQASNARLAHHSMGGTPVTATATVFQAGSGKTSITLRSSNTAIATVPNSVNVSNGATSANFTITTLSVTTPGTTAITATYGGVTRTLNVTVLPAGGVTIASITGIGNSVNPMTYSPVVTLTGPAPAGGATITLGGMRTSIAEFVSSLTIPAGATSGWFPFNARPFLGPSHTTDITATYQGITQAFRVTVRSVTVTRNELRDQPIQCASLAIAPCLTAAGLRPAVMAVGDPSKYYLYTPELQLLAETERSTSSTKPIAYSYLWFGGDPVAQISSANTVLWYATDHLGTPLLLTDATGAAVWRAELTPYGEVFTYRVGSTVYQPLRFSGQTAIDARDGYNIFRWYRSSWGRYTSPDPAGLAGGMNLYSYADASPTGSIDPTGLSTVDDATSIFWDWLRGNGQADRTYGPGDERTEEMKHAVGVLDAKRRYIANHCQTTAINGIFGFHEFVAATYSLSATQHQVGGYSGTITPTHNGFALFRIDNKLSLWSFFYHRSWVPKNHPRGTPIFQGAGPTKRMGDITQHFWWVEKLCCTP